MTYRLTGLMQLVTQGARSGEWDNIACSVFYFGPCLHGMTELAAIPTAKPEAQCAESHQRPAEFVVHNP